MSNYLDYTVNPRTGLISDAGKFEGEPTFVPYYWTKVLDGCADDEFYDDDKPIAVFFPNAEDGHKFAALLGVDVVLIWETDMGFVCHKIMSRKQYEALMKKVEELSVCPECGCDDDPTCECDSCH